MDYRTVEAVADTVEVLGPELLRRLARVREQLEAAIGGLEATVKSIEPASGKSKRQMTTALERSIEMVEQALDHLDVADQFAAGKADEA